MKKRKIPVKRHCGGLHRRVIIETNGETQRAHKSSTRYWVYAIMGITIIGLASYLFTDRMYSGKSCWNIFQMLQAYCL